MLVTGKLAEKDVRKYGKNADVYVVDIDVAAFITPSHLRNVEFNGYDLILVPGLTKDCDWGGLEREKGVKIRLGPIHAYDLKVVLENVENIEFSHKIPACRLLNVVKAKEVVNLVNSIGTYHFTIGDVKVGGRMKVVAEIVNAIMPKDDLIQKIEYYKENGADIIDLGIPLEFDVNELKKTVKVAVDYCNALSIDTFNPRAIKIGVDCGIDMVMSVSYKNLEALNYIKDKAVVVVERDLEKLIKLTKKVREKTDKVIADPVLDAPLRVAESILRYYKFRKVDSETPLLFGVGNVTELVDADSIGINALLALIAEEIGVDLLFTTEASPKTIGSVKELKIATYMAKAAKMRNSPPKDLGLSLLAIKDKVKYETESMPDNYVDAVENKEFIRDPLGDFIIWVVNDKIVCKHEKLNVVGINAKEIIDTVLANNLVSRLDHAAYLGRELKKAEIALKLRKNYVQDQEIDFGFYESMHLNTRSPK